MTPAAVTISGWIWDWIVLTVASALPVMWALVLILHFARPCAVRQCDDASAKLGSDVAWLIYLALRDGVLILTFLASTVFLFPNVYLSQILDIPITAPLSSLVLLWALIVKVAFDTDESVAAFRGLSLLLVLGAALFVVPEALGVQAVNASYFWDEYAGLGGIAPPLIAALNPDVAAAILAVTLAAFAVTLAGAFVVLGRRGERLMAAETAE